LKQNQSSTSPPSSLQGILNTSTESVSLIEREVISPKPLVATSTKSGAPRSGTEVATITEDGIISWTNIERVEANLPLLLENSYLNVSAEAKAKDILARQYFAHIAPDGRGAGDLVSETGYSYIVVGENLALGGFDSNKEIVEAWMASPGHRENMLNKRFWEIGVGVAVGVYQGQEVWVAVQHFALPLSACEQPDEQLLTKIESRKNLITEQSKHADTLRAQIEATEPKHTSAYNAKVEAYNDLVREINKSIDELKAMIDTYNTQVKETNECMAS
jgi:uncharacterized protein YkwD